MIDAEFTTDAWKTVIEYNNNSWEQAVLGTRLAAVYLSELVLGVLLNTLLICVVKLGSNTSKEVHIQLINLAIADMLFGATTCAMAIVGQNLTPYSLYPQNEQFCTFVVFTYSSLMWSSSLWRLAISIERFAIIYFPLKARFYTFKKKLAVTITVWTCCLSLGIYGATKSTMFETEYFGFWEGPVKLMQCSEDSVLPGTIIYTAILSLLPFLVIIIMYALIALKLCRRTNIGDTERTNSSPQTTQVRNWLFFKHANAVFYFDKNKRRHFHCLFALSTEIN